MKRLPEEMTFESLRVFIREERVRLGVSQRELAKRSGVAAYTVQNFELGKNGRQRDSVVEAICNALGVIPPPVLKLGSPRARAWQAGHDAACTRGASCSHSNPYAQGV